MVLVQRLRDALARLNPSLPAEALEDAFRKLTRPEDRDASLRYVIENKLVDAMTIGMKKTEETDDTLARVNAALKA